MKFKTALWLGLIIFTIHNIEEYFTMTSFFQGHQMPAFAAHFAKPIPGNLFITMIIIITLLAIGLIYAGITGGPNSPGMFGTMMFITGGLLVNGLHHLAITIFFGDYSPGVITSIFLCIPYSIYLGRKAIIERQIKIKLLGWSLAAGTLLLAPIILVVKSTAQFILSI